MMDPVNSCTDCGLVFDSSKSLDVHLSYHKENLLSKWGSGSTVGSSEDNNNVKKVRPAAADSSENSSTYNNVMSTYDFTGHESVGGAFTRLPPRPQYNRYHPYGGYERAQVTSSQVQCDKCGMSMDASLLADHVLQMHPIWDEPQAEILDLDSHKVHVYQPPDEVPPSPHGHQWKYFKEENGNSPSPSDLGAVSSSEVYMEPQPQLQIPKAAWKSNEARRPKTYNCTACNKWFTSSGHLKRHYNTTLHKNAVKQSGGVDPATMPVSSHHHPQVEEPPPPPPQPTPPQPTYHGPQQSISGNLHHHQQVSQQLAVHSPPATIIHHPSPHHQLPEYAAYHYGYHPNGNPPHGINLPSFSSLTGTSGISYEPVGGVYHVKEVYSNDKMKEESSSFQQSDDDDVLYGDKEVAMVSSTDDLIGSSQSYAVAAEPSAPPPTIHKCVDCDKTFNKACYLTQHNKSFHAGDKPFKCSRCGKRFTQEYLHLEHLSKHAGDKPYKCEMCPKQFNHKTDLRRHMCLHSGDKPFACSACGKGFIRKDHMLKHAETHRRKTNHK